MSHGRENRELKQRRRQRQRERQKAIGRILQNNSSERVRRSSVHFSAVTVMHVRLRPGIANPVHVLWRT